MRSVICTGIIALVLICPFCAAISSNEEPEPLAMTTADSLRNQAHLLRYRVEAGLQTMEQEKQLPILAKKVVPVSASEPVWYKNHPPE